MSTDAKRPPPPEELVGAIHDPLPSEPGPSRPAITLRSLRNAQLIERAREHEIFSDARSRFICILADRLEAAEAENARLTKLWHDSVELNEHCESISTRLEAENAELRRMIATREAKVAELEAEVANLNEELEDEKFICKDLEEQLDELEAARSWIACSERLPELHTDVLMFIREYPGATSRLHTEYRFGQRVGSGSEWWFETDNGMPYDSGEVTHWQPATIPKPPKGDA